MLSTLEVSKLSRWLSANARCQESERRAYGAGRGEGGGRWRATAAHARCMGRARLKAGGHRASAKHTQNMPPTFVTLDVSKLSGWLNAVASCMPSRKDRMRAGRRYGVGRGGGASGMHGEGRGLKAGGQAGGAHVEHVAHVRDAGCVPTGYVRVEILQVREEVAHIGDGRDVPFGDGAALSVY